ncbi:MAG TPA: DUF1501 domain-containing protein, partial [Gemmataceae bacterium]|nr:DUF1501 domain-containing protein [Gemmataceae bacterium]
MLNLHTSGGRLCDGLSRREILRAGSLGLLGLSLPELLRSRQAQAAQPARRGKAKSCIILFLLGGPPQHSTWDPKPEAPAEIRGEFKPISTTVPGLTVGELMPRTARIAHKLCVLRAMSSRDNAHSSSGYYMHTGHPHAPMNFENANPGPPNDYPSLGAMIRWLKGDRDGLPAAMMLPNHIFNTDGSVWPGQDAGFLGHRYDPWLFTCNPATPKFRIPEFSLPGDVPPVRLEGRHALLQQINRHLNQVERSGILSQFDRQSQQAFDLLRSSKARQAFNLEQEPAIVRDRYGRSPFGQSCLLARRLIQAGVSLVQVNWYRGPNEPPDNPCWDSHTKEAPRLKTVLMPAFDQGYAALLTDLSDRGLLQETLVVCMAEFGRSPKINSAAGRDHWGYVYPAVLAGGGIRGGQVYGSSDKVGGQPKEGLVRPEDLTATILHCLGFEPETAMQDSLGRPLPISRGQIIRQVVCGRGMRYRTFGRTGWQVSEIGYGMWGMAGWTGSEDRESRESLQLAADLAC